MYYVKFSEDGIQEEMMLSDKDPGDGWFSVGNNIDGKFFKLTASGNATAMTTTQYATFMDKLARSAEEETLRNLRDQLLIESDWTQLPFASLSEEERLEWEVYRQALRDLPANMADDLSYELPQPPQ